VRSLFVMDPLDRLNLAGDSTYMLMRESSDRGWECAWCTPDALYATAGEARARVQLVRTTASPPAFHTGEWIDAALSDFQLVWMRKDPPFDMAYIFSTYLLEMVGPGTLVLNQPDSVRSRNEKLFAFGFPDLTPPTLISRDANRIVAFARAQPDRVVLKPWDGNGGRGVVVTRHDDKNLRSLIELLTDEGRRCCIAQKHLPEITSGDKRILFADGEPIGAMLRVPGADDHRGNMHVGATVEACTLTAREHEICARIGPVLRREGLLFVGIDVIGDWLTEINVTSPTGIQEINRLDGVKLEVRVVDAAVARYEARSR